MSFGTPAIKCNWMKEMSIDALFLSDWPQVKVDTCGRISKGEFGEDWGKPISLLNFYMLAKNSAR